MAKRKAPAEAAATTAVEDELPADLSTIPEEEEVETKETVESPEAELETTTEETVEVPEQTSQQVHAEWLKKFGFQADTDEQAEEQFGGFINHSLPQLQQQARQWQAWNASQQRTEFEKWQQEQAKQTQAAPAAEEDTFWKLPEHDPTWDDAVVWKQNPTTGEMYPEAKASWVDPSIPGKLMQYRAAREQLADRLLNNPGEVIQHFVGKQIGDIDQRVNQAVQSKLQEYQAQQRIQGIVAQSHDRMYEKDEQGRVRTTPIQTPDGRVENVPIFSVDGLRYMERLQEFHARKDDPEYQNQLMQMLAGWQNGQAAAPASQANGTTAPAKVNGAAIKKQLATRNPSRSGSLNPPTNPKRESPQTSHNTLRSQLAEALQDFDNDLVTADE